MPDCLRSGRRRPISPRSPITEGQGEGITKAIGDLDRPLTCEWIRERGYGSRTMREQMLPNQEPLLILDIENKVGAIVVFAPLDTTRDADRLQRFESYLLGTRPVKAAPGGIARSAEA